MAYTIKLSTRHFFVLRRIAWGYNASIGEILHKIIEDWASQTIPALFVNFAKINHFVPHVS
jgi:hypothetical protein